MSRYDVTAMPKSKGLRISMYGGVLFLAGLVSLLVLPALISIAGMLVGAMLVWGGFVMTLFAYYGRDQGTGKSV